MKRKIFIWGFILSVAINVSVLATVGYYRWSAKEKNGTRLEPENSSSSFLYRQLSLSNSQVREMESHTCSLHQKIDTLRAVLKEKRSQLVNLLMEKEANTEKIHAQLEEIASIQMGIQKLVIDHLLEEKKILTPEQQAKFLSVIAERLYSEGAMPEKFEGEECSHKDNER